MKSRGLLFDHRPWHLPILVLHTLLLLTAAFVPSHRLCVLSLCSNNSSNNNVVHDTTSFRLYSAEQQRQQRRTNDDDDDYLPLYDVATQLLNLVLKKREDEITTTSSSGKNQKLEQSNNHIIENLIERLTRPTIDIIDERKQERKGNIFNRNKEQSSSSSSSSSSSFTTTTPTYDPTASLFDCGFFYTLYWYYPNKEEAPPIWAKLSLLPSNIKGQHYYLSNNFQQSVINYSEIYGTNIHIKAEATLYPLSSNINSSLSSTSGSNDNLSLSSSSSSSPGVVKNSRKLRTLPDIFQVDATKIILSVFGLTFDFSIKGSANLVVLYADPRLRIFVSPMESRSVVGDWESAGLVVVQVRSDLVPMTTNNINQEDQADTISKIIDLR
ncbi:hypothetical protein FRACYDRAFT_236220 [Fragilariopsis cylindrus CCMP1102]|uniref:Uncharacterized protein n=1 Tax=Fragilariopsis cylindrus CCMP1102 TaxID=635003 RepID=A0A1E7FPQ1_9STRA|nr:hypothetical protein FRACYDRAFT_236220 [Fragilariopsis cylindrus CCMP1102]|eukprot:OEU20150.1 hypothetical protein FRACYDRAFT_236220 [Fragilariopsis cylindrus CCMP1102]